MSEYKPLSSPNTEPQLLLESGAMRLRDFNPKGVLRFAGRLCMTCHGEIMDHWLRDSQDADTKGLYWCSETGDQASEGLESTTFELNGVKALEDAPQRPSLPQDARSPGV